MCGRFVVSYTYQELLNFLGNAFDIFDVDPSIDIPKYNIAPGQQVLSVISDGVSFRAGQLKWGLVPSFSKDENIGYKMINARSETLNTRQAFKSALKSKRCVILANGFYEWKRQNGTKQPMYIKVDDQEMFMFAGLWSSYKKEDGSTLYTTTIITTEANELMSDIHDRMPVILNPEQAKQWLKRDQDSGVLQSLLTQYPSNKMSYYEVSPYVNKAGNEGIECITPV